MTNKNLFVILFIIVFFNSITLLMTQNSLKIINKYMIENNAVLHILTQDVLNRKK